MKRKAGDGLENSNPKAVKVEDYCNVRPKVDVHGEPIWPAPAEQMVAARAFLRECASAQKATLIAPDKDADGLSAGVIVHRTLVKLGLDAKLIDVHLVRKGSNIHAESEREAMAKKKPKYVIVLDQGSRPGPPIVDDEEVKSVVIDHHLSDEFPESSLVVSACHSPPVATTSLMTYEICKSLHKDIASDCGYLCAIGTHGDLGNTLKWLPPFPDMTAIFKLHTKKLINDCVSYINAPRRTAAYDVLTAWHAILSAEDPKQILTNKRLLQARQEINEEVERKTHTPPKFSKDGKIAVLRISSQAQVHPVIATRWASHLKSRALEIVLVANSGYIPPAVHFSCRIARCARGREPPVDIIASLKAVAAQDTGDLIERLGANFARGHREASGGIVGEKEFEELCVLMEVGQKPEKTENEEGNVSKMGRKGKMGKEAQRNTLDGYFKKR